MTTPVWQAPQAGLPGDLNSNMGSGHLNQMLGTHAFVDVYKGAQIVTPSGAQNFTWTDYGNSTDLSQPFTMSGTTVGRVEIPLQPNGNGADVLVSLYADNGSGSPNIAAGALASTLVPAQYLNQVCAPQGLANAGPLATAQGLTYYFTNGVTTTPFIAPVFGSGGVGGASSAVVSGIYETMVGGVDGNGTTNAVYTIQYEGGGVISKGVSQPSLPVATQQGAICQTPSAIYLLGGLQGSSSNPTTAVWAAAWNSTTGLITSWSSQTALPVAMQNSGAAVWNDSYVYSVGGYGTGPAVLSSVYVASLSNGQIGAWSATTSLPIALYHSFVYVIDNWLISVGGDTSSTFDSNPIASVYYAPINASTGTIGAWQTGPSLPLTLEQVDPGWSLISTGDSIIVFSGLNTPSTESNTVLTLAWDSNGPASEWRQAPWSSVPTSSFHPLFVANGDGSFDVTVPYFSGNEYYYSKLIPVPVVSVPLPATGLTNGNTYHVVLRQFSQTSASDYVAFGTLDGTPLPAAAVTNGRYASGAWTSVGAGRSIPMSVFDQTANGNALHTWQDASALDLVNTAARWSTSLYNYLGLPVGLLEVTTQPNQPLNSNPTFTSGVSPWTATNGTITQSSAQTHGGFPFSGLLTPSGGSSQAYASSEDFPVTQTAWGDAQWCLATGWFYSSTGWSNFSLSVNWYDSGKNYISTSSATISLAATTWTQVSNWFQPPTTAAYGQLAPTQGGTPGATNLLYMSDVYQVLTPETVSALTSAVQISYGSAPYPPIGITQLN